MSGDAIAFGICLTRHDDRLPPHRVAAEAEARGFDALFLPENSHVPLRRDRTLKQVDGIERLARFHDPFVTLAACAALTRRIRLGTSVCLLTQREPRFTAAAVDTLEAIGGGRTVLGVAGGFIREAMEHHGVDFGQRWDVVRERVAAMRAIWAARGAGAGPPVWIGSNSKQVPARVASYADGWMTRRELYPGDAIADLKQACTASGRRFDDLTVALMNAPDAPADCAAAVVGGYRCMIHTVGERQPADVLRRLDRLAALRRTLGLAGAA